MTHWPITLADVRAAEERIRPHLAVTPLRNYPLLDQAIGHDIRVYVKHENHQPTCAFKVRNGLSALRALAPEALARGVVTASSGNHGQGVSWAATILGTRATVCVPVGNNPDKNAAMRALGAELIEHGPDYDSALAHAHELSESRGLTLIHATNNRHVVAGAATITLEIAEQMQAQGEPLDAMVIAVGGGSKSVGAMTVWRGLAPELGREVAVYGVQAEAAPTVHDSWHAGAPVERGTPRTFADGLATRACYEGTFSALRAGLRDFVKLSEADIADALRLGLATTHNLIEGASAATIAGVRALAPKLAGQRVGIIYSGGNIDEKTLRAVLCREI
ncbi:threonine ammonia-lyase [Haliangium ochraceum]|uniref:Pyridoxal-5'-phosphate-dependent protein beta subunit n=1 Tax=Haliangium ochraceum (strain DSM 14365 / JCM 11303 / SMP-2) TaxID=502025 RepID=D0LJQ0_HALO1|nr:threonine/serine dehydratase [Haliangium ochraceum]ACY16624.1 Pyridoxal-5'-phosphate-dependent protein beta subunit [Haliangium ochraceum DSM 14365]